MRSMIEELWTIGVKADHHGGDLYVQGDEGLIWGAIRRWEADHWPSGAASFEADDGSGRWVEVPFAWRLWAEFAGVPGCFNWALYEDEGEA